MIKFKFLSIAMVSVMVIAACSPEVSVKSTAEKALQELGNGKYAGEFFGRSYINFAIIDLYKSPYFANYEERNIEAEKFINTGQTEYDSDLTETLFETDILFKDIVFVDIHKLAPLDIYRTSYCFRSFDDKDNSKEAIERERKFQANMIEYYKDRPGFFSRDYDYCFIEYLSVPYYRLTYKLDNKYLATVRVVKVKGEKPKVTSVFIRKQ